MNIYMMTGFFHDNKFNFNIMEFPVIDYKQNSFIKYDCGLSTCTEPVSNLDEFHTGLLETDEPQISITTTNESKLELYKSNIIEKVKNSLQKRRDIIEAQLQILKDF